MVPPHPGPNPAAHARLQTWWDAEGNEHPCYVLSFWFEWATETACWPANDAARGRLGRGPIMPEEVPLREATQRPTTDIINGTIKNNLVCRVSFRLASQVDSRTILDAAGAENLLGKGDMLLSWNDQKRRLQGFYISEHDLSELVER